MLSLKTTALDSAKITVQTFHFQLNALPVTKHLRCCIFFPRKLIKLSQKVSTKRLKARSKNILITTSTWLPLTDLLYFFQISIANSSGIHTIWYLQCIITRFLLWIEHSASPLELGSNQFRPKVRKSTSLDIKLALSCHWVCWVIQT